MIMKKYEMKNNEIKNKVLKNEEIKTEIAKELQKPSLSSSPLNSPFSTLNSPLPTPPSLSTKKSIVGEKAYSFALRMIKAFKYLTNEQREFVISKQMLRSGTAIGALIREADHAQSKADFISKMSIALKEANETEYWMMLLKDSEYID